MGGSAARRVDPLSVQLFAPATDGWARLGWRECVMLLAFDRWVLELAWARLALFWRDWLAQVAWAQLLLGSFHP